MNWKLDTHSSFKGAKGPVVLVILDGVGEGAGDESDAVQLAHTPVLDSLRKPGLYTTLRAHGLAVGLPSDGDMGNSEVGHNALGCGQIHEQGASLVGRAIQSEEIFQGKAWTSAMERCAAGGALHLIILLSDGNVHSHIDHLLALIDRAAQSQAKSIYVHALLDGRDVPPTSALTFVDSLEKVLAQLREAGIDARVASGGGRMTTTMDRYGADWGMVQRGWNAHVHGQADRHFASLSEAITTFRDEVEGIGDQMLPTFVIDGDDGQPVAPMRDGDSAFLLNFRGDRALEISSAFDDESFAEFDRGQRPDVLFAGLMEYDGDEHIPKSYLVSPPTIDVTMGEYLARNHVSQLAISETQKYGHVTFFWNGNRSGMFDDSSETYIEVPSIDVPFQQRPWMQAAEITDRLVHALRTGKHRFIRVNYANGDMVGHTGDLEATICAVQVLDLQLARLKRVIDELDGVLLVTADHGNADEMYQHGKDGQILREAVSGSPMVKTSHTLNAVPFMIHDSNNRGQYEISPSISAPGIANVTATCLELLGFEPPGDLEPSLLRIKS
jgi:2,3-bisphosphoglycerate-independent phosphoglycerate mutase